MTEDREDSKTERKAARITFGTVTAALDTALKALPDPDQLMVALCDLAYAALWHLQHEMERGAPGVNWKTPALGLKYVVPWPEEDKAGPDQEEAHRVITAAEAQAVADSFFKRLSEALDRAIMNGLTGGGKAVLIVGGDAGPLFRLRDGSVKEVHAVPEGERTQYMTGFALPGLSFVGKDESDIPFAGELRSQICPLYLDFETHRAFYPVLVALHFTEGDPSTWTDQNKAMLWKALWGRLEDLAAPFVKKAGLPPIKLAEVAPPLPIRFPPGSRPVPALPPGRLRCRRRIRAYASLG